MRRILVLLMHGNAAVLLGIVTALTVAGVLHYARTQSCAVLHEMEIEQPYLGWTIVDDFSARKMNPMFISFLTLFVVLPLINSTARPQSSIEDRVLNVWESLLVSLLVGLILWPILRRKLASDTKKQHGSHNPEAE